MGRRLAAVLVPFVNSNQPRFSSVVIAFDRIGKEFTLARGVYSAGGDDELIPDIDMSGRRLIVSRYESRNLADVFIGRVGRWRRLPGDYKSESNPPRVSIRPQ